MLPIDAANKMLQRHFEFSPSIQPGLMHAVACAINITPPNTLETHQHIAANLRTQFLQLVCESDWRTFSQARNRSGRPFGRGPIFRCDELRFMAKIDNPLGQPLQIGFRAAARRIAATDERDPQLTVRHFSLTNLVIPSEVEESLTVFRTSPSRDDAGNRLTNR